MRSCVMLIVGVCLSRPVSATDSAPNTEAIAALEQRISRLERLAGELQEELAAARRDLERLQPRKVRGVTPQEAVNSFQKDPERPVTVEFGVEPGCAAIHDGLIREGDDPVGPMRAVWDNRLTDGKTLTAYLPPKAYRRLKGFAPADEREIIEARPGELSIDPLRSRVARHIEENGIRVTGKLQEDGFGNYFIQVGDAADVVTYIKGSGE